MSREGTKLDVSKDGTGRDKKEAGSEKEEEDVQEVVSLDDFLS